MDQAVNTVDSSVASAKSTVNYTLNSVKELHETNLKTFSAATTQASLGRNLAQCQRMPIRPADAGCSAAAAAAAGGVLTRGTRPSAAAGRLGWL